VIDNSQALDLIEHAQRTTRTCSCGGHTLAVARPDAVWLTCASLTQQPKGVVRKLLTLDFAAFHVDQRIVDLSTLEVAA